MARHVGIAIAPGRIQALVRDALRQADKPPQEAAHWFESSDWPGRIDNIVQATAKTYLAVFATALVARAADERIDPLALQKGAGAGGYSAPSVWKVLHGFQAGADSPLDLKEQGPQALNNQPFFAQPRLAEPEVMSVKKSNVADYEHLRRTLTRLRELSATETMWLLVMFLTSRMREAKMEPSVGEVPVEKLSAYLISMIDAVPSGGAVPQAVVAALLSTAFAEVETKRINDPSRTWKGDVRALRRGATVLAVEVKDRVVDPKEVGQALDAIGRGGISCALYVAIHNDKHASDSSARFYAHEQPKGRGRAVRVYGSLERFVDDCWIWSGMRGDDYSAAVMARLPDFLEKVGASSALREKIDRVLKIDANSRQ